MTEKQQIRDSTLTERTNMAAKSASAEHKVKSFTCSLCQFVFDYHYCGTKPPFAKSLMYVYWYFDILSFCEVFLYLGLSIFTDRCIPNKNIKKALILIVERDSEGECVCLSPQQYIHTPSFSLIVIFSAVNVLQTFCNLYSDLVTS